MVLTRADGQTVDDARTFIAAVEAARNGDPHGQFLLGEAYRLGRGAEVDRPVAEDWYRRAATQGDAAAASQLGRMLGADQNWREAILWLTYANSGGDPKTTARLAAQATGSSTERERQLALTLLKQTDTKTSVATPRANRAEMKSTIAKTAERATGASSSLHAEPSQPIEVRNSAPFAAASATAPTGGNRGGIMLQLGAYRTAARAGNAWILVTKRAPGLASHPHIVEQAGSAFRLRVQLPTLAVAQAFSSSLAAVGWQSIVQRN